MIYPFLTCELFPPLSPIWTFVKSITSTGVLYEPSDPNVIVTSSLTISAGALGALISIEIK